jgi:putative ABC transport system permease protein
MSIFMTFLIAFRALRRNAMRTMLTALGMIIGVGAVIVMVALGDGARFSIEEQIKSAGSNIIMVNAGSGRQQGNVRMGAGNSMRLRAEDAAAIRRDVATVRWVSPMVSNRQQVIGEGRNWQTQIQGADVDIIDIRAWALEFGSFFSEAEVNTAARVAVLGSVVRNELFGEGTDPTGASIRIRNQPFRVIGVLGSKGQAAMGQDNDDTIFIPYTTMQKRVLGNQNISQIVVSAHDGVPLPIVSADILNALNARHGLSDDQEEFNVRTLEEMASVLTATTETMTWLLAGIAAVSLLVGGIGIMNIMLVSVTERTREIGLRLSIGARDSDVLMQFLVEAIVLSLAGGAIGISLGFFASSMVTQFMGWPALVSSNAVLIAFGFSAAIGIFFGFYPARKAASLDPIEALRFE